MSEVGKGGDSVSGQGPPLSIPTQNSAFNGHQMTPDKTRDVSEGPGSPCVVGGRVSTP